VTDEYHENAANSAWNGDSIQLMIANEARDQQVALYNYALGGTDEEIGDIIVNHESPAADMGDVLTEAVVIRNTENGRTVYEIKLPKATLGLAELKGGVRFGLGMAINDGDKDTPGQKGWGGLGAHAIVFGKTPSETALVTLATSNDIEPGKEYYTANPTPGDITLDGELDDWTGVPVLSDQGFQFLREASVQANSSFSSLTVVAHGVVLTIKLQQFKLLTMLTMFTWLCGDL